MSIQEAAESLKGYLTKDPEDEGVFCVSVNGEVLEVRIEWIYRVSEVEALNGTWKGFPVKICRRSCW